MGLMREVFYQAGKTINDKSAQWVTYESVETEEHKTDIMTFKAKKIHNRATRIYQTTVEITDNNSITVKNKKNEFSFLKADIAEVSVKKTCLFSIFNIMGYIFTAALFFVSVKSFNDPEYGLMPFVWTFGVLVSTYYSSLIKTIKIRLKNGNIVKVYYNMKNDPDILLSKLTNKN